MKVELLTRFNANTVKPIVKNSESIIPDKAINNSRRPPPNL